MRVPSRYSTLVHKNFGKQQIPSWSRVAILSLLSCLLIPRGVELQLGTIMVDIPRILLTLFSLMAINQLVSGSVKLRITPADWLISAHVAIIALSAVCHGGTDAGIETTLGFGKGLENACSVLTDMGMAYFVARVAIHNLTCYRYYVRIVLIVAAISGGCGVIEMFTGFSIISTAYSILFPKVAFFHIVAQRSGLYRASAAFRVSLLFGLYCAIAFAIAAYVKPYNLNMGSNIRRICLALCILGTVSSLSSGSWLTLMLCLFCIIYDRITGDIRNKWKILLLTCGLGLLFLSIVSNRGPVKLIINYLTLDPANGYIRLAMWECVWTLMRDYWLLGWGWVGDWPRSVDWYIWTSSDSYYAVYLIRSGIFAILSIIGFLFYCWYKVSRFGGKKDISAGEVKGWIIGTVCLFITALTVDIFGNMIFATYFLLGAGQTLLTVPESTLRYDGLPRTIGAVQRPQSA
jgi:hypothetical protein